MNVNQQPALLQHLRSLSRVLVTLLLVTFVMGQACANGQDVDPGRFLVELRNEVTVELLAVSVRLGERRQVWRADGSGFEREPELWNARPIGAVHKDDQPLRECVLRFTGLKGNQQITYRLPGNWTATTPDQDGVARLLVPITRPDTKLINLRIGITDENWGPYQTVSADGKPIPPFDAPDACRDAYRAITVDRVQPLQQTTHFHWSGLKGMDDRAQHEVIAFDLEGKKHEPVGRTVWTRGSEHFAAEVFQVPAKQIALFQYRLLPYRYWVTFKNVSHMPGHATEVQITVDEVAIQQDEDPSPGSTSHRRDDGPNHVSASPQVKPDWLGWASPGTQLIRRQTTAEITGLVIDPSEEPLASAEVFMFGGAIYRTDEWGRFRVPAEPHHQSLMYVADERHRLWYGAPTAGDVLRITLQKRRPHGPPQGPRTMQIRLIDATDASPISNVTVKAMRLEGPERHFIDGAVVTDESGVAVFEDLDWTRYRWVLDSDHELPYLPSGRNTESDRVEELLIPLRRACELVLRAVDDETGRGLPGVKFGRERAGAELWMSVVVPDALGADRPVRYSFEPVAGKPLESEYETDAQGYYRCLVGPETWSYMVYSFPDGYDSIVPINGRQEVDIETPSGARVEYTFRLRRK